MSKVITGILIVLSTTIYAQDQLAKDILERLSSTTNSYENMTIEFDFIFENKSQDIKESQKGILILEKEKFKLIMDNQIIINDGESQWIYLADMNEVQIIEHDPEDNLMSPNKLFTIYEEGYKYTYIGAELEKGKRMQIIDLFPNESGEFRKINLAINAKINRLERITILDKNGGEYTYLIKKFEINSIINPFIFDYANFPEVEVIDLR